MNPQPNNPYQSPSGQSASSISLGDGRFRVRLHQPLPPLCALCGQASVTKRRMAFLGILGELARLNQWSSDGPSVMLPLCHRHRFFRRWWPTSGKTLLVLPLVILAVALGQPSGLALVLAAILVGLDLCLLAWIRKRSLRIRASRLNTTDVVLVGLAPEFVQACEELERRKSTEIAAALNKE